jgi:hypothetical protein
MGWKTAQDVMSHAPTGKLTWRERYCLLVMAHTVFDTGKRARELVGIEDEQSALRQRLQLVRRSDVYAVLAALRAAGLLEHTPATGHRRAVYRIPVFSPERCLENPDPKAEVKGLNYSPVVSEKSAGSVRERQTPLRGVPAGQGQDSAAPSTYSSTKSKTLSDRSLYDRLQAACPSLTRETYGQLRENLTEAKDQGRVDTPDGLIRWALNLHDGGDTSALDGVIRDYLTEYEPAPRDWAGRLEVRPQWMA